MCIRRETREKARRSLAFSRVSKPHTHITHMLRQCTSIVYIALPCIIAELSFRKNLCKYLGIKACRQAKVNAEKIHKTFLNGFLVW